MALVRSNAFVVSRSDTGDYKSLVDINDRFCTRFLKPWGLLSEPTGSLKIIGKDGID